jgi:acetate kinase
LHLSHHQPVVNKNDLQGFERLLINTAEKLLNAQSGWKALTGTSDFKEISMSSDPACQLAFDMFVDRIVGYVGSYFVKLDGKVDALVFSGGIGEHSALLRQEVVEACRCLGFELDKSKNEAKEDEGHPVYEIGDAETLPNVLVCRTDEQVSQ